MVSIIKFVKTDKILFNKFYIDLYSAISHMGNCRIENFIQNFIQIFSPSSGAIVQAFLIFGMRILVISGNKIWNCYSNITLLFRNLPYYFKMSWNNRTKILMQFVWLALVKYTGPIMSHVASQYTYYLPF